MGDQALTRPPFVGRRKERRSLLRALEQVERGRFSAVHVKGPSGIGKSSMVEHFLAEIGERRDVLILRGRCHERESVPFKAFDSLIDDLSRHLIKLPMRKAQALLPSGTRELAQIFPVLRAVSAIDASPSSAAHDPHERQRRGFSALRELLARIASRRLLVLSLDDLHWGDVDSARLLESIIAPPESPALLLVTTYRDDQEGKSPMLQAAPHLYDAARPDCGVLELGDLVDDEAVELAGRLLESFTHASKADLATTLARESQHHPLFLVELVRHAIESGDLPVSAGAPTAPSTASLSLDALLTKRVASLTPEAHRLIEVLVVAGVPIEQRVALVAAQIDPSDWKAIGALRARRLIHSRGSGDHFALEPAHQRIRRVVLETLDAQLARETSGRLARSLEATGHADPETLASMYGAAGETEIAVRFAIEAADAAAAALAFVRAAELYESARRMMPAGPPPSLTAKYAEALANAGRLYEAGNAFLEAADAVARRGTADAPLALELRRRAAEELLKSGREAEGLRVLRDVLAEVGLSYPETPLRALLSLSAHRAKTALRKLPRSAPKPRGDAKTLARADVAFTASVGLTMTDLIRGAAFGAQSLTLALEAGDPFRIGRALALEASAIAIAGRKAEAQSGRLVRAASDIEGGDPRSAALAALASSYLPFFMGDWRRAETELLSAQSMMRSRCTGVAFELINAECMLLTTLILSGQLAAAARRVPAVTKEATDRGDLYGLMQLTYARTVVELVGDRVDEARRVCGEHVPPWTPNRYTIVHWAAMTSAVSVERYAGRGAAAWTRFNREWKALQRSHLMRVQTIRVFAYFERAMCAIAAVTDGGSTELLDTAARDAEHILREDATYAAGMGHLILGCVAGSRGNEAASLSHLAGAVDGLERAEMGYLRACARVRRGELLGGGAGRQLVDDASRALAREGVESVERCVRLTAPMCRATSNGARLGGPR